MHDSIWSQQPLCQQTSTWPRILTKLPRSLLPSNESDELEVFHFFDLAAELRNLVYRELLLLRVKVLGKQWCWPAILATCHEANKLQIYNSVSVY